MTQNDEHCDPNSTRQSLFLCVRSVRHMTEQLMTIVTSLNEVAEKNDPGNNNSVIYENVKRHEGRCLSEPSYDSLTSRRDDCPSYSSSSDDLESTNDCDHNGVEWKKNSNPDSECVLYDDSLKTNINRYLLNKRQSGRSSMVNAESQTHAVDSESQNPQRLYEIGTGTNDVSSELQENLDLKKENLKTDIDLFKNNSSQCLNKEHLSEITALIRSQIEEVVTIKLSERINDKESSKNQGKFQINKIEKFGNSVIEGKSDENRLNNGEMLKMDQGSGLNLSSNSFPRSDNRCINYPGSQIRNERAAFSNEYPKRYLNISLPESDKYKPVNINGVAPDRHQSKSERSSGTIHTMSPDPYNCSNYKENEQLTSYGRKKNKTDCSIFDEFDYVSEVELESLSFSERYCSKSLGGTSKMSLYNSESSPNKVVLQPVTHVGMIDCSFDFSAFNPVLSNNSQSSNGGRLSNDFISRNSGQSDSRRIYKTSDSVNVSNSLKVLNTKNNNMKYKKTLSSSTKLRYVQYKSVSVSSLERGFLSMSVVNAYPRSHFGQSSNNDERSLSGVSSIDEDEACDLRLKDSSSNDIYFDTEMYGIQVEKKESKTQIDRNISSKRSNAFSVGRKPKKHLSTSIEYFNEEKQCSIVDIYDGEICAETLEDHAGDLSDNLKYRDMNVVDISDSTRGDERSNSFRNSESMYYNVQENSDGCTVPIDNSLYPDQNVSVSPSNDLKSETIFLQATLETGSRDSKRTDYKVYKIHLDRNFYSIDDEDLQLNTKTNNSTKMDTFVSCFNDKKRKSNPVIQPSNYETMEHLKTFKKDKTKALNKPSKYKKQSRNDTNCSLIECFLEDVSYDVGHLRSDDH